MFSWTETGPGRFRAHLPSDCAYFEGHFPGNPVLPAFAQLILLEQLVQRSFVGGERVVSIERFRFEAAIPPGVELEVALARNDGIRVAASILCGGRSVTRGMLVLGRPVDGAEVEPDGIGPLVLERELAIPQAPPATYIAARVPGAGAPGRIPVGVSETGPILREQGEGAEVSMMAAVEMMAQAMAAQQGEASEAQGAGSEEGFIVRVERADFVARYLLPGVTYEAGGVRTQSSGGLTRWTSELFGQRGSLARMQVSTFRPESAA